MNYDNYDRENLLIIFATAFFLIVMLYMLGQAAPIR